MKQIYFIEQGTLKSQKPYIKISYFFKANKTLKI